MTTSPTRHLLTRVALLLSVAAGATMASCAQGQRGDSPAQMTITTTEPGTPMNFKVFNRQGELISAEMPKVVRSEEEWKSLLTQEQFEVARAKGTERPFCGTLLDNKKEGVYACIGCGLPLFSSSSKFQSGTGWPSFFQPIATENITEKVDKGWGMIRTEIECARCDTHHGHVFDDGPRPTGLRYCVNSESLRFVDESELATLAEPGGD